MNPTDGYQDNQIQLGETELHDVQGEVNFLNLKKKRQREDLADAYNHLMGGYWEKQSHSRKTKGSRHKFEREIFQ